ncbi:MAG TPA: UDP-N-acetylmuramoyl-L-alanine--D-glutamate ligase [Candidatus Limnocylindria bacterium]|nr:UDP-N-acetylmuramoyl-L-alanine--D-glutamate ligase [Candidatus Limnocylindria bacterium]
MHTPAAPVHSAADLVGRDVLVLGLARSGIAAARFLAASGARVTVYDRRPDSELGDAMTALGGVPVRFALGVAPSEAAALIGAADLLVTSPSISPRFPTTDPWLRQALADAEARGGELLSEVELFLRLTPTRVLAVTGTKGKTTTTALLGAILEAAGLPHVVGGNIGTPLVDRLPSLSADQWTVLELSELQLPTISRGADVAVYTNITADHLDRHGTVEAYRAVKARLAELARGPVALNADDPGCVELAARLPDLDVGWYGLHTGRARLDDGWISIDGERLLPVGEVPLPGEHLLHDVLGAALAAHLAEVPHAAIVSGIRSFGGVPHRLETLGEWNGVRYVNDSQATIPVAAIAALQAFGARQVVLITGGQGKGLDYESFADEIADRCRAVVLIGETADELERRIAGRIPVHRAVSMDEAVEIATGAAQGGDTVLLSPAAASFDMFTDYAARGDAFRTAVARIGQEGRA